LRAGELSNASSKKRGPKADSPRAELKQFALVTRERDKLRVQLSNTQLVIEVQRKVAALLEQLEPLQKFTSPPSVTIVVRSLEDTNSIH
jgi:hypothetical protein